MFMGLTLMSCGMMCIAKRENSAQQYVMAMSLVLWSTDVVWSAVWNDMFWCDVVWCGVVCGSVICCGYTVNV